MEVITLIQGDEYSGLAPLFLVHAISGVALPFLHLEPLSEDDRPVYGITSPIHCPGGEHFKFPSTLPDLAAYYINGIKEIQPQGPYLLGGWSMGGMVAMFMAQILESRGDEVSKVIMIDSANPEAFPAFNDAQEHRALARATYDRTVAFGALPMDSCEASPIPSPIMDRFHFDDDDEEDGSWNATSCDSSARSSASSLFDNSASSLFDSPFRSSDSLITPPESVCDSDEEYDSDFDDEPPELKDYLRLIKLHIHLGLELMANVSPGELIRADKTFNFDAVLIKCAQEEWQVDPAYPEIERLKQMQQIMGEKHMRWDTSRFRSFESVPFSGDHDGAFQPRFVGELSDILRECLEDED